MTPHFCRVVALIKVPPKFETNFPAEDWPEDAKWTGQRAYTGTIQDQSAAEGGVIKGGVCKRKRTRANADKRRLQAV